jgi:predicted ribosomally synthesized peptide with nif11-like leader
VQTPKRAEEETMSGDSVSRFFEAVNRDEQLARDYRSALERAMENAVGAALVEVGARHGFELSSEDVRKHLRERAAELTDDQLEAVAGGLARGRQIARPGIASFLKNPWVLGAIVATAIAVPLAISDEDDGA